MLCYRVKEDVRNYDTLHYTTINVVYTQEVHIVPVEGQGLSVCSQMEIDHLLPAYHFSHQLEIIRIRINKTRRKR